MIRVGKNRRDQNGLASLIVVSVLVVLLTLISLGFARLMSRSSINSTNRQLSNAATYAAQSGINDVVDYMKQYAADNPADPYVASPECTGNNSLIGSATNKGPFYRDSNLSGDTDRNVKYSCILLNQTPTTLVYTGVPVLKSQVIRLNTSAFPGSFSSLLLSWQATNSLLDSYPPATPTLYDETSWNNSDYTPMLRVTIYPVPFSGSTSNIQANSKTFYLYPQPNSGGVIPISLYNTGITNGQILPVSCNDTPNPVFNGKPDYKCNLIIGNLLNSVSDPSGDPLKYVYLRVTPIYGQADIEIMANDTFRQPLKFIGVQAVVDVTATTSNVAKRLQARVNIGDETSSINDNISAASNDLPEFSMRSSDALCKQITVHNNYFKFITFDGASSTICNTSPNIVIPAPSIAFSIIGNNGTDNGRRVCSTPLSSYDTSQWGCASDNNPDSPQNPVQKGTVYVGSSPTSPSGAATLNWNTSDATSCVASGGWSGQVLDNPPYNTTWTTAKASGSYSVPSMDTITDYTLTCQGPGSSAPIVKTATAWPYPHFTDLSISPNPVHAGQPYSVRWATVNTTRCTLSGDWPSPGNTNTSDSETVNWTSAEARDPNYSKSFTVTCYDPIGRPTTGTITINNSGGSCSVDGISCPGGGGGGRSTAPDCSVSVWYSGTNSSNSALNWSSTCADWDASNYWWPSGNISYTRNGSSLWAGTVSCGWMRCSGTFNINNASSWGSYCFQLYVWADYWQSPSSAAAYNTGSYYGSNTNSGSGMANSGKVCKYVPPPPLTIDDMSVGDLVWYNPAPWDCSIPDGAGHTWFICSIFLDAHQNGVDASYLHCQIFVNGSPIVSWSGYAGDTSLHCPNNTMWWSYQFGWYGDHCSGPSPSGAGASETIEWRAWSDVPGSGNSPWVSGPITRYATLVCPPPSSSTSSTSSTSTSSTSTSSTSTSTGGGGCFVAGTLVKTPTGEKAIETLRPGDQIETYDFTLHRMVISSVVQSLEHKNLPTLWVVTSKGSVVTTPEHRFWTKQGWVAAGDLVAGESYLVDSSGHYQKVLLIMAGARKDVYNLHVSNADHDYYAGDFLVHNFKL